MDLPLLVKQRIYIRISGRVDLSNVQLFGVRNNLNCRDHIKVYTFYTPIDVNLKLIKASNFVYDQSDVSKFIQKDVEYEYSTRNYQLTKIKEKDYITEFLYPADYILPDGSTSFIQLLKNEHRHSTLIEKFVLKKFDSQFKVVDGEINIYGKNVAHDADPLVLTRQYKLELGQPLTKSEVGRTNGMSGNNFLIKDHYRLHKVFRYQPFALPHTSTINPKVINDDAFLEKDALNSAVVWDKMGRPIAKAKNATGWQIGFNSFEAVSIDQNAFARLSFLEGNLFRKSTNSANVHSGENSYHIPNNSVNNFPTINLRQPTPKAKGKYKLSCWIKTSSEAIATPAILRLYTASNDVKFPLVSSAEVTFPIPNTNNEWNYVEVTIDLDKVISEGKVEDSKILSIIGVVENLESAKGVYVDDIRIHPVGAQMTTYTYSPFGSPTSVTDENNITTYTEYDGLGRVNYILDQDRNVVKSYEYNFK